MANVKKLNINNEDYDIVDANAGKSLTIQTSQALDGIHTNVSLLNSAGSSLSNINLPAIKNSNTWTAEWTGLNSDTTYTDINIHNDTSIRVGDIIVVSAVTDSVGAERRVDIYSINASDRKIFIQMTGEPSVDQYSTARHLSPTRVWTFLVTNIDEDDLITLWSINTHTSNSTTNFIGNTITYNESDITVAANKVLAGYGSGEITSTLFLYPMDADDHFVRPTSYRRIRSVDGRSTYIFYYENPVNTIVKLATESLGGAMPSIPYMAMAPYNGGYTYAPLYYDPQTAVKNRGWKFGDSKNFTSRSYNWFIINTIN